jgi:hypothetical protein
MLRIKTSMCTEQIRILSMLFITASNAEMMMDGAMFLDCDRPRQSIVSLDFYLPCRISIHLMASVSLIFPR